MGVRSNSFSDGLDRCCDYSRGGGNLVLQRRPFLSSLVEVDEHQKQRHVHCDTAQCPGHRPGLRLTNGEKIANDQKPKSESLWL